MDADIAKQTLARWASEKVLSNATLSDDGDGLTHGDTTLPGKTALTIEQDGKSCSYSLTAIYLQIVNPSVSLVDYRKDCKKHGVDPVKASEKPLVLGYFLGSDEAAAPKEDVAAPSQEAAVAKPSKEKRRSSKHDRHHKDKSSKKRKHSSSSKHHSSSSKRHHKEKTTKAMVTNEELFDNLQLVVGKREGMREETAEEITQALSTDGFVVTDDMLQRYKETTEKIVANEIPVGNSASILRAANPRKDLSRVLELFLETVGKSPSSSSRGSKSKSGRPSSGSSSKSGAAKKSYLIGKKPIILVPKGMTAPITLLNAHEFLGNSKFVPRDVMLKSGRKSAPITTFTRKMPLPGGAGTNQTGLVEYEIMDNPKKLNGEKDWERVVAVIVLGQAWQFKDWPGKYKDPVHLFQKTMGFHVVLEGDKIPPESQGWAIQRGKLNRDKRGLDSVTAAQFWNKLDEFMRIHKRELLPQAQGAEDGK